MPLTKNQIVALSVESLSSDGSGVGHIDGEAVFVPETAPGDELRVRIVKDCKRYAFGIVESVIKASGLRCAPDCAVCAPCGGCCFRHLDYAAELDAKSRFVADAFARLGGFSLAVAPAIASPEIDRYRNKVQFPVGRDAAGHIVAGFYAGRSHRIVPCTDCKLQPEILNRIAKALCTLFEQYGIEPYDEISGKGCMRHIFLRRGAASGEILVCLVSAQAELPHAKALVSDLRGRFPAIKTVVQNINSRRTNVILGEESHVLSGDGFITDTMCGVPIRLGPLSFYQVNTPAAEVLYKTAARFAALKPGERLLDLYCGMGTIGLSMVQNCAELVGVEVVPEAIEAAKRSAAAMGPEIAAKSRFLCGDASAAAAKLAAEGQRPDVVILDPPRKGCDTAALDAVIAMAPSRIVMVSCNPATAARDAKYLAMAGWQPQAVQPVDLFPRTRHVESVVLMSRVQK